MAPFPALDAVKLTVFEWDTLLGSFTVMLTKYTQLGTPFATPTRMFVVPPRLMALGAAET